MNRRFASTDEDYGYRVSGCAVPVLRTISIYFIDYARELPGATPNDRLRTPKFGYLCLRNARTDGLTGRLVSQLYEYGVDGWQLVSTGSPWIAAIRRRMEGMDYGYHHVVVTL